MLLLSCLPGEFSDLPNWVFKPNEYLGELSNNKLADFSGI